MDVLAVLVLLFGPLMALLVAAAVLLARAERRPWRSIVGVVVFSATLWLVYVGLYQHESPCAGGYTDCPTVYGYDAPLHDEHALGAVILFGGFALVAVWSGWRRSMNPVVLAAALAVGPTVLAIQTAPRGDNDGLWALILWFLPVLGLLAGCLAAVVEGITEHWRSRRRSTTVS